MLDLYWMPCVCSCGECDDKVGEVLRMEESLCAGAKRQLGYRRKQIQRKRRSEYNRRRYERRKLTGLRST